MFFFFFILVLIKLKKGLQKTVYKHQIDEYSDKVPLFPTESDFFFVFINHDLLYIIILAFCWSNSNAEIVFCFQSVTNRHSHDWKKIHLLITGIPFFLLIFNFNQFKLIKKITKKNCVTLRCSLLWKYCNHIVTFERILEFFLSKSPL